MENENEHGYFGVRLEARGGYVVVELTGEHFRSNDVPHASDVYLVRDSAVALAMRARGRAEKYDMTKEEAFAQYVLWNVELPECDLSIRLREAISDVIGSIRTDVPWDGALDEEEVNEILNEMKGEEK